MLSCWLKSCCCCCNDQSTAAAVAAAALTGRKLTQLRSWWTYVTKGYLLRASSAAASTPAGGLACWFRHTAWQVQARKSANQLRSNTEKQHHLSSWTSCFKGTKVPQHAPTIVAREVSCQPWLKRHEGDGPAQRLSNACANVQQRTSATKAQQLRFLLP